MPVVRQFDAADCGVAALASVARFYGRSVSVTFLRDVAGTESEGTTLHGLCAAASAIGFEAHPMKVSQDRFDTIDLPVVIHWDKNHWVVLYQVDEHSAIIGDPALGVRKVTREQLQDSWSGYAAVLTPTDALAEAPVDTASLGWIRPLLKPHRGRSSWLSSSPSWRRASRSSSPSSSGGSSPCSRRRSIRTWCRTS